MKKVLIRFFSSNNLGDDLFVKCVTQRYENKFTTFISRKNSSLANIKNLKVIRLNRTAQTGLKILSRFMHRPYIWLQIQARYNDLILNVGGSIFQQLDKIEPWEREAQFYKQCNIPYYILGSNIGPYSDESFLTILRNIFQSANDVCFRDSSSYKAFSNLSPVRLASDLVFTLDISSYPIHKEKLAIFSIINCKKRFSPTISENYNIMIVDLTKHLLKDGYRIVYMSFWHDDGDLEAVEEIHSLTIDSRIDIFDYRGNLEEAMSLIAKSEIIIASRFHAVILGLLFGKKVLPMAYSDKTTNILSDMNFKGPVVDIRKINDFSGKDFDFSSLKINNIDAQIKLAEKHFQELDKVLEKRA